MPDPIRKGSLKDQSFARVYYALAGQGKTGFMDIMDETDALVKKRIFFLAGDTSFVQYGPLTESLGQILMDQGIINDDQLEEAIDEIALTQKQLGQIMVEKRLISREKLHELLVLQTELKIISCFAYNDGVFQFTEESVAKFNHDVPMHKIVPDRILYQGVMKHYPLDRLEAEFEHAREKGLGLASNYSERLPRFLLLSEEEEFVKSISAGKPFGQVLGKSGLGLTRTLKILYVMLVSGVLEITQVTGIKSVKVEDKDTVRRKSRTIELEDVPNVKREIARAAKEAMGDDAVFADDGKDFGSMVTDYLTDRIAPPAASRPDVKGDLVQYQPRGAELEVSAVSDVLRKNKRFALDAYLGRKGGDGAAKIGDLLVQNKIVEGGQLQLAYAKMRESGQSFLNALAEIGAIRDEDMHEFLSEHFKVPAVKLADLELDQEIVSLIPEEFAKKHRAIPINRTGKTLVVAMADPSNISTIDEIKFLTEYNVEVVVATENDIKNAIDKYHDSSDMLDEVMANFDDSNIETATFDEDFDLQSVSQDSETAPVVKLVNQIMADALGKGASDIHFEPYESAFRVRYRIDGVLYHILSPPWKLRNALVSRVKIMSRLDIAERRLPQDGRISLKIGKKKLDFRVSTLPTLWGEKLVLRILDKESLQLDLTKLGMEQEQLENFRWAMHQPYGMVLVTGPSGCGKTTTLYSALIELNKVTDNVSTAEDPIEYYLEGINQVQMHDEVGMNFAYALRSFLRQDPDIIMVGEIRDFETAEIAVKAALTGHVVLSTVHTNDAPSTINRLLNMGVEPFLITASMNAVASQRLVRKLCDSCKQPDEPEKSTLVNVGVPKDEVDKFTAYKSVGCSMCNDRGYKGRIGIYEVMPIRGDISEFILAGATPSELKREAMRRGMRTMRQAGLVKVSQGITTLEEITRTTIPDFLAGSTTFEDVN
jgi:type IV pilus assembly protein PilB